MERDYDMNKDLVCTVYMVAAALEGILEECGTNGKVYGTVYASAETLYSLIDELQDLKEDANK